ncbi:MAG: hypothetical protein H6624_16995 [Bdellovibrionaceae bacterium]|nr:hypothetical protein [Pseudobdellovibrionaceae bacterium]
MENNKENYRNRIIFEILINVASRKFEFRVYFRKTWALALGVLLLKLILILVEIFLNLE